MTNATRNKLPTMALVVLCTIGMTVPLLAQDTTAVSDSKLELVANAFIEVRQIQNEYSPQIESATSQEEAQAVQEEASRKMIQAIEETDGLEIEEYNQIMAEAQENEQLRTRLIDAVERTIAERSEEGR